MRETDARLPRVAERIYDEIMSGQASARGCATSRWKVVDANRSGGTEFPATEEDLESGKSMDLARNERY